MFNSRKYTEIQSFLRKRHSNTKIIAISKNQPKEAIEQAIKHGLTIFGENKVLEAKLKFTNIKNENQDIELHLTGPLQSNKVKTAIELFDVFHTLDREKIANEFSKFPNLTKRKKFFIQVNTGKEVTKSGVYPNEAKDFIQYCRYDKNLEIEGLMCIPPIEEKADYHFEMLHNLAKENEIKSLSIGMSSDYEHALKYNPTYIRLGTILFGSRK